MHKLFMSVSELNVSLGVSRVERFDLIINLTPYATFNCTFSTMVSDLNRTRLGFHLKGIIVKCHTTYTKILQ